MERYDIDGQQEIVASVDELGTAGYLDHCPRWAQQATGPVTLMLDEDTVPPEIHVLAPQPGAPGEENTTHVVEVWDRDRLGVHPVVYWRVLWSQSEGGTLPTAADVLSDADDDLSWDTLVGGQSPRTWADNCRSEDDLHAAARAYAEWAIQEMDVAEGREDDVVTVLLDYLAGEVGRDDVADMAPEAYVRLWDKTN